MPKPTNWATIENLHGSVKFGIVITTGDEEEEEHEYVPVRIKLDATVVTDDGLGRRQVSTTLDLGTPQATPFDLSTQQGRRDLHAAVPAVLRSALAELVQDAIDEDVSV